MPQGSILGPLLFNVDICDLFILIVNIDIANYADDNTPYTFGKCGTEVISQLQEETIQLFKWFSDNGLKANADKCHLLSSMCNNTTIQICNGSVTSSKSQKLLGVNFVLILMLLIYVTKLVKS